MPRTRISARSLLGTLVLVLPAAAPARSAEYPGVAQLPSRPEMPDPLVMLDGRRVSDSAAWSGERRPELKALFAHYMYGAMPPAPATIRTAVAREEARYFGGKATKKEVTIAFGPPGTPEITLLLVVPNHRNGPAPVFLGLNFYGNHTTLDDPAIAPPTAWVPRRPASARSKAPAPGTRGSQVDVWAIEDVVDHGYALATFYCGDVAPDHPGFTDGVHPHYLKPGQTQPGPHDWGTVAAWAWGLSRAIDYLVTDPSLNRDKIAVVGHSRLGKAALVAAAFDERVALVIPHQAGCGGSAPSRGKVGESVKQINDRFPHWFNAEFKTFNEHPDRLPFDQNGLVALVAPRPVLFTNGVDDTWANPEGQFAVLRAASPVYRFLGVEGLKAESMPAPGVLVDSRLGYHIRPGKHSMGKEDWPVFLRFADTHLGKPAPAN